MLFAEAGPDHARRGARTPIFGEYFFEKTSFVRPKAQFWPREHHAVIRLGA